MGAETVASLIRGLVVLAILVVIAVCPIAGLYRRSSQETASRPRRSDGPWRKVGQA